MFKNKQAHPLASSKFSLLLVVYKYFFEINEKRGACAIKKSMLFDRREKSYLFFSLFSLISSPEKSRGRFREK